MKIILNQDVPNLGEEGDVCVVKDGYARNYLLPTGAAVIYNKTNIAIFKSREAAIEKRKIAKREESATLKERLDNLSLNIIVAAGESGKLFGSVTAMMVQEALSKLGFEIEKKKIEIASHAIKMTGTYTAKVHLYENDSSVITLNVKSEAQLKAEEKASESVANETANETSDQTTEVTAKETEDQTESTEEVSEKQSTEETEVSESVQQ